MSDLPSRDQSAGPQPREMNLADVVAFVRRHLLLICGLPLAAGLVTGVTMLLAVPRSYEASATLVVVPPKFASDLKPSTLTIQGYQKLLESDAAIAETKRRLVEKGVLKPDAQLRLNRELESRIFVSRRADELSLAPMLQAVARGTSPAKAAAIANTWAEVFLERTKSLMAGSTSSTVQFIDEQYPKVRAELATLEDERVTTNDTFQKRYDSAADQWDQKVGAFKNQTSDLLAGYQAETRRLVEEYSSGKNLDTRNVQLAALRKAYSDLQDEQARVSADLQQKQLQADAARTQLAVTAQFLTLQKAITDEALWAAMVASKDDKPDWKKLQDRSLATQEINPVYTRLADRLSQVEIEVNALVPRAAKLAQDLATMSEAIKEKDTPLRLDEAGLEKLKREREAGLDRLKQDRDDQLEALKRQQQFELDGIKRAWDAKVGQLDRDVNHEKDLFTELAKNYNQALLAKAQQDVEDVRIGAVAVPADHPQPRGTVKMALLLAVVAGLFGVGIALVSESLEPDRSRSKPARQ